MREEAIEEENTRLKTMLRRAGVPLPLTADVPTEERAAELLRMVEEAHPVLKPDADPLTHRNQFLLAMRYLAHVYRRQEVNTGVSWSYWTDAAREFLNNQGHSGFITLKPFVAAVIASGISYTALTRFPFDLSFGISLGTVSRASAEWRRVLTEGIPPPTKPRNALPRRERDQQILIVGG